MEIPSVAFVDGRLLCSFASQGSRALEWREREQPSEWAPGYLLENKSSYEVWCAFHAYSNCNSPLECSKTSIFPIERQRLQDLANWSDVWRNLWPVFVCVCMYFNCCL